MSTITEKATVTLLDKDLVEERINLIKKEISDFPEYFDDVTIHKISRINSDIDRIAIIDKNNITVFLDMETTNRGKFLYYTYLINSSKYYRSDSFTNAMAFIFGAIAYTNMYGKYDLYIKETSLKDNKLFKSIMDYKKINKATLDHISIYDAIRLVYSNPK